MVIGCAARLAVCATPREAAGETAERFIVTRAVLAVEGRDTEAARRKPVVAGRKTDERAVIPRTPRPVEVVERVARADGEVEPG
jgi:hypothetical protein